MFHGAIQKTKLHVLWTMDHGVLAITTTATTTKE